MVTDFDKFVYNTYLKVLRSNNNKPYKLRKDFSTLNDESFVYLKKLVNFFSRNKNIKPEEYFNASFKIYSDSPFLDLKHFTTLKATKAYTIVQKQRDKLDPDNIEQLEFTKKSLQFIKNFCNEQNKPVKEYANIKHNNMFTFLLHLKERSVNIYSLFGFENFERNFKKSDLDVIKFMLGEDFIHSFDLFKIKFLNSKKCKVFVEKGIKKIKEIS